MPETRANVVDSSVSALTRPRCSSISGRSSLEIRRTSSSARRTACFASSISWRCAGALSAIESSCSSDAGQHLADLVVQVAGDADPLGLLGGEHAPAALLALALEPVEHPVEGGDDAADLVVAVDLQALTGPQQVDRLHSLGQPLQRGDAPVAAAGRSRSASTTSPPTTISACVGLIGASISTGLNKQQSRKHAEQPGVDGEDTPEERTTRSHQLDVSAGPPLMSRAF